MVNDTNRLEGKTVAILSREGVEFSLNAEEDTKFLVLTGQPLNEPIEGYGPFVMNAKPRLWKRLMILIVENSVQSCKKDKLLSCT